MKLGFVVLLLSLPLGACGTVFDPSKLVGASAQTLTSGLTSQLDRERALVTELQSEDETLRFLSKGRYSCDDPIQIASLLDNDTTNFVSKIKIDKRFSKAQMFVDGYLKALNAIVAQNKDELEIADAISGISGSIASLAPNGAAAKAAIGPLTAIIKDGITDANVLQMKKVAYDMEPTLEAAISVIKKLYPAYFAAESDLYRRWNSCALEKLRYLRDEPNGEVAQYEKYKYIFGKNGGVELDAAYNNYITKRVGLSASPLKDVVFDAVITENKKLITGDLSVQSVDASLKQLVTLRTDFQNAVVVVQPLMSR
jgi:hypothetical protein